MKKDMKLFQHCDNKPQSSNLSIATGVEHLLLALLRQSNAGRDNNARCYIKDHKEYDYEMDANSGAIPFWNVESLDSRSEN